MNCSNSFTSLCLRVSFTCIRNCSTTASGKGRPKKGLIYQPSLSRGEVNNAKKILGLHVGSNYVSWVTVEIEKYEISQMGLTSFPENFEKMNLSGLSSFASQSFQMLPRADYYVTEEAAKVVSGTASRQQLLFQSSRMQYVAMLVALINFHADAGEKHENRVLFLKHKMSARLFGLVVGTEIVSSTKIVTDMLNQNSPPRFSPLKCSDKLKSEYSSRSKIEKEILGYSFMSAVTFLELIVRKNPKCYEFAGLSNVLLNAETTTKKVVSNINK